MPGEAPISDPSGQPKIQCSGLWKLYGREPAAFLARHDGRPTLEACKDEGYIAAVRDVSFSVPAGEILVVMGLSGSGKSTLVRCLSRLIDPTAGQVLFEGQDITQADEKALIELRRHKMGMVFQNFGLLPHRTAQRNVSFPLEIQGVPRAERERKAAALLELVGLGGRGGYFPRELSGGQQQRVGIARSLAVEPDLWFLDEPFSALDPLIRREMQDEFLRLQRLLKKTIVFITHDFDEAVRVADRIAIMQDGAVVQLGTPEELVTAPADPYVAEFTKSAPRGKLISAAGAMLPLNGALLPDVNLRGEPIRGATKIEEAAARVLRSDAPLVVVDLAGQPIGLLTRARVIEVLFGKPPA